MAARMLVGTVKSKSDEKTIRVNVMSFKMHKLYKKILKRVKLYHCHNEGLAIGVGNVVEIQECRPYSKTKRWKIVNILRKGNEIDDNNDNLN